MRKPLLAVSDVNEKGNLVLFDGHQSFIMQPSEEVEAIRRLVMKAHLENGTFKLKAWQPEGPFGRQGKCAVARSGAALPSRRALPRP